MIAVVGNLVGASVPSPLAVAAAAAAAPARVEVVGVVPGDAAGDQRLQEISSVGAGHAAVLRSMAAALEPTDLELALRYLPDLNAIVLVGQDTRLVAPAAAAADWSGAGLVIIGAIAPEDGDAVDRGGALVLGSPSSDPDGSFAGLVAALAVRLDAGDAPAMAWQATVTALAIDRESPPS